MYPQSSEEMNTDEFKFCFIMLNIERYINFIDNEHCIENEPGDVKKGKEDWIGSMEDLDHLYKFLVDYDW